MSCGLGAIVLVFMLVKFNIDTTEVPATGVPQTALLEADLARLQAKAEALQRQIAATRTAAGETTRRIEATSQQLARVQAGLTGKRKALAERRAALTALSQSIKNTEVREASDVVEDRRVGEENYVIGLNVEGRKIGILVDRSASMTDDILIDVIRRKNGAAGDKQAGPKWQRTKRVVKWLLARLPHTAEVNVVAFNGRAQALGGAGWKSAKDGKAIGAVLTDLETLVPEGPTNLQAGLDALVPTGPSNLYVITDSLPTTGDSDFRSLNPFSTCSSLWGASNTISGACRLRLLEHTLADSAPRSGVPVNVILLPIEGDPGASTAYWSWTAATGGVLISPAPSWP